MIQTTHGNVAVIMALMLPAFVGLVGLSVETGYWYFLQDRAQTAADVSAFAGASTLRLKQDHVAARQTALREAQELGYIESRARVAANIPPLRGPNADSRSVEVVINYPAPRYFSGMFNRNVIRHEARAVAAYMPETKACILSLDPTASRTLELSGASLVNAEGCEIMANSVADDAIYISGTSDIEADCISTAGGIEVAGNGTSVTLKACELPKRNMPPAQDPYRDVPMPDTLGPCAGLPQGFEGTISPQSNGTRRFCGGLSLSGQVRFEPGVYIIDGGSFRINSGAAVTGEGVTFVTTRDAEAAWNGQARIEVSAPTLGTYEGLLFMGDRSDTRPVHRFNGTADTVLNGSIYTPASAVEYLGDFAGAKSCLQLIGARIKILGTADISSACETEGLNWARVPGATLLVE